MVQFFVYVIYYLYLKYRKLINIIFILINFIKNIEIFFIQNKIKNLNFATIP